MNTTNFDYAIFDLRTKFSIVVFGIIFSTLPNLNVKEFRNVLMVFVATVLISSLLGVYFYYVEDQVDFRAYSPFISHVRFALNICLSIYILGFFLIRFDKFFQLASKNKIFVKSIFLLIIIWLLYFLSLMQSLTGIGIVFTVFVILPFILFYKWKKTLIFRYVVLGLVLFIPVVSLLYILRLYDQYSAKPKVTFENLEKLTKSANPYRHDTIYYGFENGKWTGLYLCEKELRAEWNKLSDQDYDSKDKNGFFISSTIIRYLTSKDLRKDKDGLSQLTATDIKNIERGIANVEFVGNFGFKARLYNLFFEIFMFETTAGIKGSSAIQRLELLKNALNVIYKNPVFGVGTGDVADELASELVLRKSELQNSGMRTHNQYITFIVSFGFIGFSLVIFSFIYLLFYGIKKNDTLIIVFYLIFLISNIAEDTLESLHGAAFYSFFGALFLFLQADLKIEEKNET
jgi:O-antigen ligase